MNTSDFDKLAEFVESLWGESKRWDPLRRGAMTTEFLHVDLSDAVAGTRALFDLGSDNAPSPSMVKKETKRIIRERIEKGGRLNISPKACRHKWAIWDEERADTEKDGFGRPAGPLTGRRLGKCTVCGVERWFGVNMLLTMSELEDRKPQARGDEDELDEVFSGRGR